jgi:butyryl-CoA dehydrogenase
MAIRTFAAESMSYRVVGMIEAHLAGWNWEQPDAAVTYLKAVEEFAAECSYIKVYASEALDFVADEGVQIHGGYGYHQDYLVERAYRDSRINRIFEGTNEINRLLATGYLLKRAQRGQLGLVAAVKQLQAELMAAPSLAIDNTAEPLAAEAKLAAQAKKVALLLLGAAYQRFLDKIEQQQEVMAGITDVAMSAFAIESVVLRAMRLAQSAKGETARAMAEVFARESMEAIEVSSRMVLAACAEGDNLRLSLVALKRLTRHEPVNAIQIRRRIAERLLASEKYVV